MQTSTIYARERKHDAFVSRASYTREMRNTYKEVVAIISTVLEKGENEISKSTNLFEDLDVDSLNVLEIVNRIEETWKINFDGTS